MYITTKTRFSTILFSLLLIFPAFAEAESITQENWHNTWNCQDYHAKQFESSVCKIAMGANGVSQQDIGHSEIDELIGVEMWAGMAPPPSTRSIVLYKNARRWLLEAFVYESDPSVENGYALALRHTRVGVPEARVIKFMRDTETLRSRLKSEPMDDCRDAAILEVKIGYQQAARHYSRDACSDPNHLDDLSAEMMSLAIELDPSLASYADTMAIDLGAK